MPIKQPGILVTKGYLSFLSSFPQITQEWTNNNNVELPYLDPLIYNNPTSSEPENLVLRGNLNEIHHLVPLIKENFHQYRITQPLVNENNSLKPLFLDLVKYLSEHYEFSTRWKECFVLVYMSLRIVDFLEGKKRESVIQLCGPVDQINWMFPIFSDHISKGKSVCYVKNFDGTISEQLSQTIKSMGGQAVLDSEKKKVKIVSYIPTVLDQIKTIVESEKKIDRVRISSNMLETVYLDRKIKLSPIMVEGVKCDISSDRMSLWIEGPKEEVKRSRKELNQLLEQVSRISTIIVCDVNEWDKESRKLLLRFIQFYLKEIQEEEAFSFHIEFLNLKRFQLSLLGDIQVVKKFQNTILNESSDLEFTSRLISIPSSLLEMLTMRKQKTKKQIPNSFLQEIAGYLLVSINEKGIIVKYLREIDFFRFQEKIEDWKRKILFEEEEVEEED